MNMNKLLFLKIIIGLVLIWGGFKLQKMLWPVEQNNNTESITPNTD